MEKLKKIEENTREHFFVKQELEQSLKSESESRIQLMFYSQKTGDFEQTLRKTCEMMEKFRLEVMKVRKNAEFIRISRRWARKSRL